MSTQPTLFDQQAVAMPKPTLRCSQKTGHQLKKEGQARAAEKHSDKLTTIKGVAVAEAEARGRPITIENVRERYEHWYGEGEWDIGNAAGSVFADRKIWQWVGFQQAKRPEAHARILRVWRLKR